jgi:hypothetical protein
MPHGKGKGSKERVVRSFVILNSCGGECAGEKSV